MMDLFIPEHFFDEEEREGFTVPPMMKRCWATKLKMLAAVDDICMRHGIRYYVDYGTLLGAARHRGFIPWDDDIDISMLREDYNRALPILRQELPETYEVFVFGENLFTAPWSYLNNRRGWDYGDNEEQARITAQFYGDPYCETLDLFPLDYVPADKEEREAFLEIHQLLFDVILQKKEAEEQGILEDLIFQIGELTGQEIPMGEEMMPALCRLESALAQMYTREQSIGINNIGNMARYDRSRIREFSWYERTIRVPFEMIEVPVPAGYREIITSVFGQNWMTPVRGTAAHEYPCYQRQERVIRAYWDRKGKPRPDPLEVSVCG